MLHGNLFSQTAQMFIRQFEGESEALLAEQPGICNRTTRATLRHRCEGPGFQHPKPFAHLLQATKASSSRRRVCLPSSACSRSTRCVSLAAASRCAADHSPSHRMWQLCAVVSYMELCSWKAHRVADCQISRTVQRGGLRRCTERDRLQHAMRDACVTALALLLSSTAI